MRNVVARLALCAFTLGLFAAPFSEAQIRLLAVGSLNQSSAGAFTDLSGLTYSLESGVPANSLGGFGSGLAYGSDNNFLALPDRGPNADTYDAAIDNTTSYVNRFHTIKAALEPNKTGAGLPYTLNSEMQSTTLLWSPIALVYGSGDSIVGSGAPPINTSTKFYFTGRSDNFDGTQNSGSAQDARFDTEGIRLSNDGNSIFISDEYGPYVYQFDRNTGARLRTFTLPAYFYVTSLSATGATEISGNSSGRVANKGMEGLAITPDGTTLVGIMQNALAQDTDKTLLRIVTIDIATGTTHQYGYRLTIGSGASEILAINNHEFLVDERDGKGRGDGPPSTDAKIKQFFKIDLTGATDISAVTAADATTPAVTKPATPFLNLVTLLTNNGFAKDNIPAKIEGITFGRDIKEGHNIIHTLWIANDNDFEQTVTAKNGDPIANPNQFFVVGFTDSDLGSTLVPQEFTFKSLVP